MGLVPFSTLETSEQIGLHHAAMLKIQYVEFGIFVYGTKVFITYGNLLQCVSLGVSLVLFLLGFQSLD